MKILGIESSGKVASVAVSQDENLLGEYSTNFKKTHSQTLMPMLSDLLGSLEIELSEIDYIAISAGPGSFTGLRIGSATVKGLGLALDVPIVAVPTIKGMAYNYCLSPYYVCPIMDARRDQVYTGIYKASGDESELMQCVYEDAPRSIDELIDKINTLDGDIIFLGDGVPRFRDDISDKVKVKYHFAPYGNSLQRASSLCLVAEEMIARGDYVDADDFVPNYMRKSQAEREREALEAKNA